MKCPNSLASTFLDVIQPILLLFRHLDMPLICQQKLYRITVCGLMLELPDSFNYIPSHKLSSKCEPQSCPISEQNR